MVGIMEMAFYTIVNMNFAILTAFVMMWRFARRIMKAKKNITFRFVIVTEGVTEMIIQVYQTLEGHVTLFEVKQCMMHIDWFNKKMEFSLNSMMQLLHDHETGVGRLGAELFLDPMQQRQALHNLFCH